eukprot:5175192-Pleurochrysis_carterae.AAC.2
MPFVSWGVTNAGASPEIASFLSFLPARVHFIAAESVRPRDRKCSSRAFTPACVYALARVRMRSVLAARVSAGNVAIFAAGADATDDEMPPLLAFRAHKRWIGALQASARTRTRAHPRRLLARLRLNGG